MSEVPDISKITSECRLDRLMDKAANYNDSLKAINQLKKQFEVLGLELDMIMGLLIVSRLAQTQMKAKK
jgi:hypothetical protein